MNTDAPRGWELRSLRSACLKTEVWNPAREKRVQFQYIDVSAVSNESFSIVSTTPTTASEAPSRARKIVRKEDVLFATVRPSLHRVAMVGEDLDDQIASTAFCVVRANPNEADARFLYYKLLTPEFVQQVAEYKRGVSYPAVTDKDILDREVLLPRPDEQRRIAAVLGKLQRAVGLEAAQERAARELKQAAMHRLFTRGLSREPTRETPLGSLPESWKETKIAGLGEIVTGTTPKTAKREYYDGGEIPFLAPGDLGDSFLIEHAEKKITEAGAEVSRVLPKLATCFVCIGSSVGKVGVTTAERSTTNQQINAVVANEGYDPLFVGYLLAFHSLHIASHASPSPVPIMSKGKFGEVSLWVTRDKDEQREIAAILGTLDRKIALHAARCRARRDLFRSTLHALLSARLRVPAETDGSGDVVPRLSLTPSPS